MGQLQKSKIVIPAELVLDPIGERESSLFYASWTPAFAGVTVFDFCIHYL